MMGSIGAKLRRFGLWLIGRRDCPICREQALQWHKAWAIDPEEPPLFGWWECNACGAATDILPTTITERAVRDLGYDDFNEYAERNLDVASLSRTRPGAKC